MTLFQLKEFCFENLCKLSVPREIILSGHIHNGNVQISLRIGIVRRMFLLHHRYKQALNFKSVTMDSKLTSCCACLFVIVVKTPVRMILLTSFIRCRIYPNYSDRLAPYRTCPKSSNSFSHLFKCLTLVSDKQCRP